jgi:hypothetical protein
MLVYRVDWLTGWLLLVHCPEGDQTRKCYEQYKEAMNPASSAIKSATSSVKKLFGGAQKPPSPWIAFVKEFAAKNKIPYKQALSEAGPVYRQLKGKGYSQGSGYSRIG